MLQVITLFNCLSKMKKNSTKLFYSAGILLGTSLLGTSSALAQITLPNGFSRPDNIQVTNNSAGSIVYLPTNPPAGIPNTLIQVPNTLPNVIQALDGFSLPREITATFPTPVSNINILDNFQPGNPINANNLLNYNRPDPNGPVLNGFPWRPGYSAGVGTVGGNVDLGSNLQTNTVNWDTDKTTIKATFNNFGEISFSSLTRGDWFNQVEGNSLVLQTNYNQANNTQFAKAWVNSFFNFYQPLFNVPVKQIIPSLSGFLATPTPPAAVNTAIQNFLNTPLQGFLDQQAGGVFNAEYVYNRLQQNTPGTNISGFQRISNPNLSYILKVDRSGSSDPEAELLYDFTLIPTQTGDEGLILALETTYFGSDTIFQITQGQSLRQAIRSALVNLNSQLPGTTFDLTPAEINTSLDQAFAFFLANTVQLVEPVRVDFVSNNPATQDFSTYQFAWQAAVSTQFDPSGATPDFPTTPPLNSLSFLGKSYSGTYDPVVAFPVAEVPPPPPQATPEPSGIVALLGLSGFLIANKKRKQA